MFLRSMDFWIILTFSFNFKLLIIFLINFFVNVVKITKIKTMQNNMFCNSFKRSYFDFHLIQFVIKCASFIIIKTNLLRKIKNCMLFLNESFFIAISKFVNTWICWSNLIWFNNSSVKVSSFKIQKLTKTLMFEIILFWSIFKTFNKYIIKKTLSVFKTNAKYKIMLFS